MTGIGQPLLPRPNFSPDNPFWRDYSKTWNWLAPALRPRNNAQDFLYATTWELWGKGFDIHSAYCTRMALISARKIMRPLELRDSIKNLMIKQKELQDEKVA